MSVDRASLRTPEQSLEGYPGWGLASFPVSLAESLNQQVIAVPELFNLAHVIVQGNKTKSTQKAFAKGSTWVVPINSD